MRKLITITIIFVTSIGFCQVKSQNIKEVSQFSLIEERNQNTQDKISELQSDIDRVDKSTEKNISDLKTETKSELDKYKTETKDLINLYVFFITVGLVLIGFAVNFFGSQAIKIRVEELILEKAQKHIETKIIETLNSKITSDLIENIIKSKSEDEINKIICSIQDKGNSAIDEFKTKGVEIIKSMLATPPKVEYENEEANLTDDEITIKNNKHRAKEFFNLAYSSSDPRIQIELYKNVLELDPNNKHAMNNMGLSHNNLNEPEAAILLLDKAIAIDPDYYYAYSNRAQAYNLLDNFDEAIADVNRTIEIEPTFEYAYSIKGNVLTKQGLLTEAEIELNKAIQMSPNSAEAHYNIAFFYEEQGKFENSLKNYLRAEELDYSNKAMLYNNMAVLYRRQLLFDKAIEFINKAKQYNPNFPNLDGTLALIYADMGDEEQFYSYLKKALEKGCAAWKYLSDSGFEKYRNTQRLNMLLGPYKKKYYA